jgi:class 3 adenylate cyclase/pimeloyl-ACP methyl ester carboxylesterase
MWIDPGYTHVLRRLASFAHTVIFDPRGLGLSDPLDHVPTVEEGADDLEAVMDSARLERAVLVAMGTAYPAAAMFAARAPERVDGLVLVSPWAVGIAAVGDTSAIVGYDERMRQAMVGWQDAVDHHWGEGRTIELIARSIATPRVKRSWGMLERAAASPAMIRAVTQAAFQIDLREILTAIQVPTIVVAREGSYQPRGIPEHVADLIPGAEFDWQPEARATDGIEGFMAPFIDAAERMVRRGRSVRPTSRILATVLFTDIVGSTQRANTLGDHAWRELLDRHESLFREHVTDAGGRVIKMIGDGSLSIFDGPGRPIRCAADFAAATRALDLDVRAGLHTGECEILNEDIAGLAVHIAARVNALAAPGEVLVSRTVRDLVVGSGLQFNLCGTHELKGVPDSWELFALANGQSSTVRVAPEQPLTRPYDRIVLAAARRPPSLVRLAGRFART